MLRDRPHVVVEVLLELEDLLERPAGLRRVEKHAVYRSVQVAVVRHSLLERVQHPLLHVQERAVLRRDVLDELLHMMSCKAAIKSGDPLSPEEINTLIEHRALVQDSHHCPHGRPTTLVFTQQELDRRFKRI